MIIPSFTHAGRIPVDPMRGCSLAMSHAYKIPKTNSVPAVFKMSKSLKKKMKKIKSHLELLSDPLHMERSFDGVYAIRDSYGVVIKGVVRYSVSNDGPTVAILGGIHMNEMSGVSALMKFHNRWVKGLRPKNGNVIVATGDIERAQELIDLVLESDSISSEVWGLFGSTIEHFNYNRIPFDILTKKLNNNFERRAYNIVKHVLQPSEGRILDIHSTSTNAPPMVTLFMKEGETAKEAIARINSSGMIKNLPIEDYIFWKPGPYNGVESIRSIGHTQQRYLPLLVETGAGHDPKVFDKADEFLQIWLKNVMKMEPEIAARTRNSGKMVQKYYIETAAMYHPAVRPSDYYHLDQVMLEKVKGDTFILIRDYKSTREINGWSEEGLAALEDIAKSSFSANRLNNFRPMKEGEAIAIGQKTGYVIRAPHDGYTLMVGSNPRITSTFKETFANFSIMKKGSN